MGKVGEWYPTKKTMEVIGREFFVAVDDRNQRMFFSRHPWEPNIWYWGQDRMTHCSPDIGKVVEVWGICDSYDTLEKFQDRWDDEHPAVETPYHVGKIHGIISPEGKYFECDYMGHDSLAGVIMRTFFRTDYEATSRYSHWLRERGWRFMRNGIIDYDENSSLIQLEMALAAYNHRPYDSRNKIWTQDIEDLIKQKREVDIESHSGETADNVAQTAPVSAESAGSP